MGKSAEFCGPQNASCVKSWWARVAIGRPAPVRAAVAPGADRGDAGCAAAELLGARCQLLLGLAQVAVVGQGVGGGWKRSLPGRRRFALLQSTGARGCGPRCPRAQRYGDSLENHVAAVLTCERDQVALSSSLSVEQSW